MMDGTHFFALFCYLIYIWLLLFAIAGCQPVGCLPASVNSFLYFDNQFLGKISLMIEYSSERRKKRYMFQVTCL